jgi:anaerobic selenocysteine-containing dehydrogenase
MSNITACPLDCYDGCCIEVEEGKLKPLKSGHTQGFLCPHLNHYDTYETIASPRYDGKEISMNEALIKLGDILQTTEKEKVLHYRGNGNFGLMQAVSDHFFASYGAVLTDGNLCDGAGEAGIIEGRGSNKNMSLQEIAKSEVVIIWGRNVHVTSSHLLPVIEGKKIIVIDPVETKIAKKADIYIQIKPHTDLYLAMLLSRFLYIENGYDSEYLERYAPEYEEFYELTQTIRIKATLEAIDVTLGQIGQILELVRHKKVAIVCGVGIQKYRNGAEVMRAIDAFAVMLGLFGKEGCGVAYLGNSKRAITSPFMTKAKRVSKVDTDFSRFTTVFVQGANPLSQMPDSLRVKSSMQKVTNLVYFGLYENETSQMARLVIPAKNFLSKNDVRTSYSHDGMMPMPKLREANYGISEYELSAYLCETFGIALESEEFYLEHFKNFAKEESDGSWHVAYEESEELFDTDDGEFCFLDEYDNELKSDDKFFLLTPKSATSLNSMFKREKYVYLHSSHGFSEAQRVCIASENGSVELEVKIDDTMRQDSVLIYNATPGVNNITSSKHSFDGKNAIYQENKVEVKAV